MIMKKHFLFAILILFASISQGVEVCCARDTKDGRSQTPTTTSSQTTNDTKDGRSQTPTTTSSQTTNTVAIASFVPSPHAHVQTLRLKAHEEPAGPCDIGRIYMNTAGDIQICQDDGFGTGVYNGLGGTWRQSGNSLYPSATAANSSLKVGIGTTAPEQRLHLKDGNFLASKEYSGATNNSLLYFDAAKGALMTGQKYNWAMSNLSTLSQGIGSLSVGLDATASGNYALAVGNRAIASGTNSVAIGRNASAQGNNSVVINLADSSSAVGTTQANTMTILGGKVGIGVANPTYQLELPSVSYTPTRTLTTSSPTTVYTFNQLTNCPAALSALYAVNLAYGASTSDSIRRLEALAQLTLCHMFGDMRDAAVALTPNVGAMTGLARASSWHAYSDGRFKTNLQPVTNAMNLIEQLNPVYYNWIIHYTDAEGHLKNSSSVMTTKDIGLIAQDVYKVIPEIVRKPEDESKSEWSLDYARLTPVLIQALKEQRVRTKLLRTQHEQTIAALRDELNTLKEELKNQVKKH